MDIIKRIQDLQLLCRLFFSSSKFGRVFFVGGFFLITQELPVFFLGTLKLLVGLANLHSDSTPRLPYLQLEGPKTTGVFDSGGDFWTIGWQIGTEVSQNLELKKLLFVLWTHFFRLRHFGKRLNKHVSSKNGSLRRGTSCIDQNSIDMMMMTMMMMMMMMMMMRYNEDPPPPHTPDLRIWSP